jgi:hypothetical protein
MKASLFLLDTHLFFCRHMAGAAPPAPQGGLYSSFTSPLPGQTLAGVAEDKLVYLAHVSSNFREWKALPRTPVEIVSAPSLATFNGALFVLVTCADKKVYFNVQCSFGFWGGWAAIPDGGTDDGPLAVADRNALYVFVRGVNNAVYYKTFTTFWSNWVEIPGSGRTSSSLGGTVIDGVLNLVVRGVDQKVYIVLRGVDGQWSPWMELPGNGLTLAGPVTCAADGAQLLALRGTDNHVYINVLKGRWEGFTRLPMLISHRPAMSVHGRTVTIFARNPEGRLVTCTRDAAGVWGAVTVSEVSTKWLTGFASITF